MRQMQSCCGRGHGGGEGGEVLRRLNIVVVLSAMVQVVIFSEPKETSSTTLSSVLAVQVWILMVEIHMLTLSCTPVPC